MNGKTIRLACNLASNLNIKDAISGENPIFWRGAQALLQGALFSGTPGAGTFVANVSDIISLELLVRKHNARGPVLIDAVLLAADLANSSYAAWAAGTGQQFTFSLQESYTSQDVLPSGSLPIFFVITAITATTNYVVAQGYGQIVDVGIADVVAPFLPSIFVTLAPAAAGSTLLSLFRGGVTVTVNAVAGVAPYVYVINLPTIDVIPGAFADVSLSLPAAVGRTIKIRDTLPASNLLHTVISDSSNTIAERVLLRFDGQNWVKFGPATT